MANSPFIGRRESIGWAPETTPGTSVAPVIWEKQTKLDLDQSTTVAKDTSGIGRIESQSNSAVTEEWADGSIEGLVHDLSVGYLLNNVFGTCTSALHGSETAVWDNTFTVSQTAPSQTLTFTRSNPEYTRRYAMGTLTDFEIDVTAGGWVTYTGSISALIGATSADTPSYVAVNAFTSKHTVLKYATTVSGLTAATALQPKSLKLKISRKADRFTPLGAVAPIAFDQEDFQVTGEFVTRFTETAEETIALANTIEAMSIAIINTDVTIGSATNPGLTFTMPQVRFTPIKLDDNLNQVLNQTVSFTAELSVTAGNMITALLTNTQDGQY